MIVCNAYVLILYSIKKIICFVRLAKWHKNNLSLVELMQYYYDSDLIMIC